MATENPIGTGASDKHVERHVAIGATLLEALRMKGVPLVYVVGCGAKKFVELTKELGATRSESLEIFRRFCIIAEQEEAQLAEQRRAGIIGGRALAERRLCEWDEHGKPCGRLLLETEEHFCTYHAAKIAASAGAGLPGQ